QPSWRRPMRRAPFTPAWRKTIWAHAGSWKSVGSKSLARRRGLPTRAARRSRNWFYNCSRTRKMKDADRGVPSNTACSSGRCRTLTRCDPRRYSINVTLDGCCDHRVLRTKNIHRHAVENLTQADALILGRVTYEMMEAAWRLATRTVAMPDWTGPFARTIDAAKKYVVSSTLDRVDWNAELVRGDLGTAVQQLKQEPGKGLFTGGVKLPLALAELGLIDEYEFVVHPRLAGHGPTLFAGLSRRVDLKLVSRLEFGSGAVAIRYE